MPSTKAIKLSSRATVKSPSSSKSISRTSKKSGVKPINSKKKAKPVIVDVIEDESLEGFNWPDDSVGKRVSATRVETIAPEDEAAREKFNDEDDLEEIDQQKKFFSSVVSEIKDRPLPKKKKSSPPNVGLYRRFVIKFLILVGLLAVAVAFFCFSRLTIYITSAGETINDNLLLKVSRQASSTLEQEIVDQTDPRVAISGTIQEVSAQIERTYQASGEEFIGEEIIGQVRIINNYNKNQALVATTRILSPDNKLFRLKEAVNVPAGGEVTVSIYTEKPSEDLAIGPTTFTIPGLWLGLQDKIYARSDSDFVFQKQLKKYVKASDIERAVKETSDALVKTAKEEATAKLDKNDSWLYTLEEAPTITVEAVAGEEKEEFKVSATGKIVAVSFVREEAAKLAANKLNLLVPDNKQLTEFKPENISYNLENYDAESGVAVIKASFGGTMILKSEAEIVDREQLINLTAAQIAAYLNDQPNIKSYELKFTPRFVKKAPRLVDRIIIKVN